MTTRSPAGPSASPAGYELPASVDLAKLAGEITTLMNNGSRQTIVLGVSGAALVLNGATLSFAVLGPAATAYAAAPLAPHDSVPHD